MSEAVRLLAYGVGVVLLFGGLGSAAALILARGLPSRVALAPVLGFAIAQCALTTAGWVIPMRVAAWVVLLPLAVASTAWSLWRCRRGPWPARVDVALPLGLSAAGLVLALSPGLARGTVGPTSVFFSDGWAYILSDLWLRNHTFQDVPATTAARDDLVAYAGWADVSRYGVRPGSFALNSAVSELFRTTPDQTQLALLAAVVALVPLAIWFVARALGVGRWAAALGACFGLSPAVVMLAGDSALGNLTGVSVLPVASLVAITAITQGGWRLIVLGGLLLGGMMGGFVEAMTLLAIVAGIGAVFYVALNRRRPRVLLGAGRRLLVLAVVTAAASPVIIERATHWLDFVADAEVFSLFPRRYLAPENAGSWAFGLMHLYELPRFDALSAPAVALAVGVPALLAAAVVWGVAGRGWGARVLVLGPIVGAVAAGWYSYEHYGNCEYCAWKSFTLILPFLGVGVALGAGRLLDAVRGRRGSGSAALLAAPAAIVAAFALAGMARADVALLRLWDRSANEITPSERALGERVAALPGTPSLMLEGQDATRSPAWTTAQLYYLTKLGGGPSISFDGGGAGPSYLQPSLAREAYYFPNYSHVLTTFAGVSSDRRAMGRFGRFTLFRRAPIDVAVVRTGFAVDDAEGGRAIPWIIAPAQLWIASPRAVRARLWVTTRRPLGDSAALLFSQRGIPIPTVLPGAGLETAVCVDVRVHAGRTVVDVTPYLDRVPPITYAIEPTGIFGAPLKAIGIAGLRVQEGMCPGAPSAAPGAPAP